MSDTPLVIDIAIESCASVPPLDCIQEALQTGWGVVQSRRCESVNQVAIKIMDTDEMTQLNQLFRQKEGPTNVLSFPSLPIPGILDPHLGDIAICAPVVWEEANLQKIPLTAHWAHLSIHGLLHLLGYEHETDEQADVMQALEIKALKLLGWPNPYLGTC